MQIIELRSPRTTQPTSASHGEMKNKEVKKVQFGGWNQRDYKSIRRLIKKLVERDFGIKLGNQYNCISDSTLTTE